MRLTKNSWLMAVFFMVALLPPALAAEEVTLGKVERFHEDRQSATIAPVSNRPALEPLTVVVFYGIIPGIDEKAESARGYLARTLRSFSLFDEEITVKVTEGEPAIDDEAAILRGQYKGGSLPRGENAWNGMVRQDLEAGANKNNADAMCELAHFLEIVLQDYSAAFKWYQNGVAHSAGPYCTYSYAEKLYYGSKGVKGNGYPNDLPAADAAAEAEKWALDGAERGHAKSMLLLAHMLKFKGDKAGARKWLERLIAQSQGDDSIPVRAWARQAEFDLKYLDR